MNDAYSLQTEQLTKTFRQNGRELTVLADVTVAVERGAVCAIVGPSGSGKTTFLGLCAGLDEPTSGRVYLEGRELNALGEDERAAARGEVAGFVFQQFNLFPTLTALENVMVPLELNGSDQVRDVAASMLERVGLGERLSHYPGELSGGEQQRVALARAFVNRPRILFADEPTGNLDTATGRRIEELIFELNEEEGTTLLLVTHDERLAQKAERTLYLEGGRLIRDSRAA